MLTLIVDDHPLFSDGLRLLLMAAMPHAEVRCCDDGATAIGLCEQNAYELVLLDWNLGDGVAGSAVLTAIKERLPQARVVIVSGDCEADIVRRAIDAGAVGFVPKESSPALLIDALTITSHGGIYLPVAVLTQNTRAPTSATGASGRPSTDLQEIGSRFPGLTPRHVDVLDLLVRGMPNKSIARHLGISEGTVKQHLNAIFRELEVDNRTEAVYAIARSGVRFA